MTCKDCEHCAVCKTRYDRAHKKEDLPLNVLVALEEIDAESVRKCVYFKDKSKIIELPCKVGDTVYSYRECFDAILPYFVETLTIGYFDEKENYYTIEANCTQDLELLDCIDFDVDDIGKTVFLTREEAEKALEAQE